MKVENIVGRSGRNIPNQFIITDAKNRTITFQSYNSMIATIDDKTETVTIGNDWNYSTTTAKYRNMFFDAYMPSLNTKKELERAIARGCTISGYKVIMED